MKKLRTQDAIGTTLGQDLTRVVPGEFKGIAFKKGHIVMPEDVPVMLSMGKDHVYVFELGADDVHENEAAEQLADLLAGTGVSYTQPGEGKVDIIARHRGMLKIDRAGLAKVNEMAGIAVATLHGDMTVHEDERVASIKVIPLVLRRIIIDEIYKFCGGRPILDVIPYPQLHVGLIITGNEIYFGRIEDKFAAVLENKLRTFGAGVTEIIPVPDDVEQIAAGIKRLALHNDLVIVAGGMSVDPDDVTPEAIARAGAMIKVYGTPVQPGAMFLAAYLDDKPILGIPACGMYNKITLLDVILPKVMIGEKITKEYIASLGYGGLCRQCEGGCRYPACSFAR